jgi:hypothetical protein
MGWSEIDNVTLLSAAEGAFDAMVTTDRSLRHQQNLAGRRLTNLVLPTTSWRIIRLQESRISAAIDALRPGDVAELQF